MDDFFLEALLFALAVEMVSDYWDFRTTSSLVDGWLGYLRTTVKTCSLGSHVRHNLERLASIFAVAVA